MIMENFKIGNSWDKVLNTVLESNNFKETISFVSSERQTKEIFPTEENIFKSFRLTPFNKIVAVILGMDPYPNKHKGQIVANGLAFSTDVPNYTPPSLKQIYKAIKNSLYQYEDTSIENMNLNDWAQQGVFLLNTALTIESGKSGSHLKLWEEFTTQVIKTIDERNTNVFFCLWGKDAQKFEHLISDSNYILKAPHPISASYRGQAWECDHFKVINEYLRKYNGYEVSWIKPKTS